MREFSAGMMVTAIIVAIVLILFRATPEANWRKQVIEHGCGHYDSQTGHFTWDKFSTRP